ncbi:hypothetical protein CLOM_g5095 [Closterium sp. NIES-68]|nr:hypothetical protein CLOM_g5095 [Closterium sp. NIES-68]GJP79248.1 hypothetical protein CLOP_g9502 [Closterium sp. NIES-67]
MIRGKLVGSLSIVLFVTLATVYGPNLSHRITSSGGSDCDVCSSQELLTLRALYQEHQAALERQSSSSSSSSDGNADISDPSTDVSSVAFSNPKADADISMTAAAGVDSPARADVSSPRRGRSLLAVDPDDPDLTTDDIRNLCHEKDKELLKASRLLKDLDIALQRQYMEVDNLNKMLDMSKEFKAEELRDFRGQEQKAGGMSEKTREFLEQCKNNLVTEYTSKENKDWAIYKGYACEATDEEIAQYMNYELRGLCPDDWFFVQHLIFVKNCYALPKRRCLARTPQEFIEPLPRSHALFNQKALHDGAVRWSHHGCKSFDCLNHRTTGDCKSCFNMTLEANRWKVSYRGALTIKDVISIKKGSLRLGLDAGRGTGSFAAHMARYNVTVMTMAMNIETRSGVHTGLPYMETIALRGLVPLHIPHTARLPFFDNTLDLVHCVNSVKYLPLGEFEDLLYEWDRVLRVGGVLWFELFYAPEDEMKIYIQIVDLLQYNKLYWNITSKPEKDPKAVQRVYLNCLLEKPPRID